VVATTRAQPTRLPQRKLIASAIESGEQLTINRHLVTDN